MGDFFIKMVIYTVYCIWLYSYRYLRAINFKIITIIISIIITITKLSNLIGYELP